MLTIPGHKGNANQNHTKIQHHQKHHQQVRMWGKKNLYTLLVGSFKTVFLLGVVS
jgi:hypothetical protein